MKYKWLIKEHQQIPKDFLEIAGSEIVAKLLLNRGIDSNEKAKSYLNPKFYKESPPEEIPNLTRAKDRIIEAINKKEKITIFGDYDVDGVTSTSCLLLTLKQFTDKVDFYIPSRLTEGYGLNNEAVRAIAKKNKKACRGTPLLITCDCGVTNHKEIELANELGMDVIVTDHHSLPELLPPAYAVLNPKVLPSDHKLHFLPGVGVAYKLAQAILRERTGGSADRRIGEEDLLDLVTLGMIADLAPLVDENRYLVQIGLPKLAKTEKIGLQELLKACGLVKDEQGIRGRGDKGKEKNTPNAEHVGFGIAPRINAVGRLTDAALAVKLLTTDNLIEAVHIASELEMQNRQRQILCENTLNEAVTLVSERVDLNRDKCIVLANDSWHHGVIGIVASRIVEKFNLPTILIAVDKEQNIARGSGRSIEKLNITEALVNSSKYLEKFGGHKAACGLSVRPELVDNFISDFTSTVNSVLGETDLSPVLKIDLELPISSLNMDLINQINKLAPFGFGNRMPVFASDEVEIIGIKAIGKNGQHLKLLVRTGESVNRRDSEKTFEALIWNHDQSNTFSIGDKLKIAYTAKLNNFNGETSVQLEVKDWEITKTRRTGEGEMGGRGDKGVGKKRENNVKLFDFRERTQECLDLFSSKQTNSVILSRSPERSEGASEESKNANRSFASLRMTSVIYFAETEQKNYFPLKTHSRNKITKAENLVFLESPPDEIVFLNIIKNCTPSNIYFAFSQSSILDPQLLALSSIKNLTGMLKYAKNNKGSRTNETELQSAIGLNKSAFAYALETLVKIGFLSYERVKEELSINILDPTRQNFDLLLEYNLLVSEIKEILEFKNWILKVELTLIEKILKGHNIQAEVFSKEPIGVTL